MKLQPWRDGSSEAGEAGARGVALPATASTARARWSGRVDDHVAVLTRETVATSLQTTGLDEPASDAGPEGDEDDVVHPLRGTEHPLGDGRARRVVVDPHLVPEFGAEPTGDVEVGDAVEIRSRLQHTVAVDESGHADTEFVVRTEHVGQFGEGVDQLRDRPVAAGGGTPLFGDDLTAGVERDAEALGAADVDADGQTGRHERPLRPRRTSSVP